MSGCCNDTTPEAANDCCTPSTTALTAAEDTAERCCQQDASN